MNDTVPEDIVRIIRGMYQSDETARALFDHFAGRKNKANETTADAVVSATGAWRADGVNLLKKLSELGLGQYYIGRRGSPTRIEWLYDIRNLGRVAQGAPLALIPSDSENSEAEEEAIAAVSSSPKETIHHSHQLRSNFQIQIALPADLTDREAERIGVWVRSLPFGV